MRRTERIIGLPTNFAEKKIANCSDCYPALAFTYYHDGKPVYRAINEFAPEDLTADQETPSCRIGENFFRLESAPYGSGYLLSINAKLRQNRQLEAHFEWLSIESDFLPEKKLNKDDSHIWNLVTSRADVTGKITVSDEKGKEKMSFIFAEPVITTTTLTIAGCPTPFPNGSGDAPIFPTRPPSFTAIKKSVKNLRQRNFSPSATTHCATATRVTNSKTSCATSSALNIRPGCVLSPTTTFACASNKPKLLIRVFSTCVF